MRRTRITSPRRWTEFRLLALMTFVLLCRRHTWWSVDENKKYERHGREGTFSRATAASAISHAHSLPAGLLGAIPTIHHPGRSNSSSLQHSMRGSFLQGINAPDPGELPLHPEDWKAPWDFADPFQSRGGFRSTKISFQDGIMRIVNSSILSSLKQAPDGTSEKLKSEFGSQRFADAIIDRNQYLIYITI
mmetsp:Transcript_27862/g.47183  ORF Transcript_27862/g.47183 Transcript_27862/m.47183 type:complete len:190 (-) Transcript_27862:700-1269(-)